MTPAAIILATMKKNWPMPFKAMSEKIVEALHEAGWLRERPQPQLKD